MGYHQPGGFLRRLEDGTWLGHVVEHVALELQTLAGTPVTRGKTRSVRGHPGVYNILFAYEHEAVGMEAGITALRLVDSLLPKTLRGLDGIEPVAQPFDFEAAFTSLKTRVRRDPRYRRRRGAGGGAQSDRGVQDHAARTVGADRRRRRPALRPRYRRGALRSARPQGR